MCSRILFQIASSRRYARIPARTHIVAHICAMKQSRIKSFTTNIETIPKNMSTNFELKRLKPKLDTVEKPENRVHKLTDSNGARMGRASRLLRLGRACGQVRGEYSCRCHGKRVISAPSKPLKLKLAGPGQLGTFYIAISIW